MTLIVCHAYGGMGGYSGGSRGYGNGAGRGFGGFGGANDFSGRVIPAAIQSRHNVQFFDVPSTGSVNPTTIEVGANSVPLQILFRSASSNLNIQQAHDGAQGSVQESQSEGEIYNNFQQTCQSYFKTFFR